MPPRPRRRKASTDISDDGKYFVPSKTPARTQRAPKRKPKAQQTTRDVDDSEEIGRWQYPEFSGAPKKRKLNVGDAKKQIHKQGDELMKFIEEKQNQALPCINKDSILEVLTPNVVPVLSWMPNPSATEPNNTTPREKVMKVLDELHGMVDYYEAFHENDKGVSKPTWMRWEQDGKELGQLNHHAMTAAAKTIHNAIIPSPQPSLTSPPGNASDIEKMAWELLEDGRPAQTEQTWGTVAHTQVKAFSKVLSLLPNDSGVAP